MKEGSMNRIVSALAAACCALLFAAAPATALTFKMGEVLGPDGTIYQGASPEERERLIKKAAEDGETAGVSGSSLFAVSYTHLRAHETCADLVCRLLLEKKK